MSRTLTISEDLYEHLAAEAHRKGLGSVEELLEQWRIVTDEEELQRRREVVRRIDELREHLFRKYGRMPDSVELIREDRER